MVNVDQLRSKINTKIFTNIGSTATLSAYTQGSLDKWGDQTPSYGAAASITVVPWRYIADQEEFYEFGDLHKGEVDLAVKYDQTIAVNDRIVYDGKTYKVKDTQSYVIKDAVLVKAVRLVEAL